MFEFIATLACAILGWCGGADRADGCRDMAFAGVQHTVCSFDVADVDVRLFLNDDTGEPYRRLSRLRSALPDAPLMLMNGGMYHDDLSPVGLYVESGRRSQTLSTKGGWGNFHLLPNGVFWGSDGKVFVTETKRFADLPTRDAAEFATQSGPMLVIDGKLHPRFIEGSDSLKIRNGVGISDGGKRVHFAISHAPLSFYDFGLLFRDELKSDNALFLDGTISAIDAPGIRRGGVWKPLGPMIGVFAKD